MRAFFDHAEPEAEGITSFWFKPEQPLGYLAGQYVDLELPGVGRRWFTLSSSPSEAPLVSVTTKLGSSPFKAALGKLRSSDTVHLSEPIGDFVLPKDPRIPMVFVAAGIGITPVRSIVKFLLETNEQREITLIYAVSQPDQFVFQSLFESYKLNFISLITKPSAAWRGESGQLAGRRILELAEPANNTLIYLSGPEPMVEALHKELLALKIPSSRLVTDLFTGYKTL